jgi:hypothetical protein
MRPLAALALLVGAASTIIAVRGFIDGGDLVPNALLAGVGLGFFEIGVTLLRRARARDFDRQYPRIDTFRDYLGRTGDDGDSTDAP